jgi:hypothetical protein
LDQVAPSRAGRIVEQLRDGTNLVIEFVVDGQPLCAVIFVDHNQGGAAKDAFLVPESLDGFLEVWRRAGGSDDTQFEELTLAEAAVAVTESVDLGAITWPPYESESWPQTRPLVRWLVRRSPAGAAGPARPEWDDDAREDLVAEFLASRRAPPWRRIRTPSCSSTRLSGTGPTTPTAIPGCSARSMSRSCWAAGCRAS